MIRYHLFNVSTGGIVGALWSFVKQQIDQQQKVATEQADLNRYISNVSEFD